MPECCQCNSSGFGCVLCVAGRGSAIEPLLALLRLDALSVVLSEAVVLTPAKLLAAPQHGKALVPSHGKAHLSGRRASPVLSLVPLHAQDAVSTGGPLLALLGFIVLPLVWSVPEALVTAELATAFPEDSGYVAWVTAAFGPFWGFQEGWWSWLSGVTDNSVYPVLLLSYVDAVLPGALSAHTMPP